MCCPGLGRSVLASTLLAAAGPTILSQVVAAAEVRVGGALDVTITGAVRFLAAAGDLERKGVPASGSIAFFNDPEINLLVRGLDEATSMEYGAVLQLAVDTVDHGNADSTWLFVRGGWGEARFGDDEGPAENMRLGGFTVAVGTGGIDGTIVDTEAVVGPFDSGDATKIVYYAPSLGGVQLGIGYTPHGEGAGGRLDGNDSGGVGDLVEAGLVYAGETDEIDLEMSVVGGFGHVDARAEDQDVTTLFAGGVIELSDLSVAAGWGGEEVAGTRRSWWNAGIAYTLDALSFSLTYGACYDCDEAEPTNLVAGVELGLLPGLALSAELSRFDEDQGSAGDGLIGVARLEVEF
jgi:hypothetical protein